MTNRAKNALIGTTLGPALIRENLGSCDPAGLIVSAGVISAIGAVIGLFLPPEDIVVYEAVISSPLS